MAEQKPKKSRLERDIEGELDQLLSEINTKVPNLVSAEAKAAPASVKKVQAEVEAPPVAPAPAPQPVAATTAVEKPAEDLVGDALAAQIQQMLDDAKAAQAQEVSSPPQADASNPVEEPTVKTNDSLAAKIEALVPGGTDVPQTSTPADTHLEQAVQAIDDDLARQAEGAVAGDFESVQDVMSAAMTPTPAPAAVTPAPTEEASAVTSTPAVAPVAPEAVTAAAAPPADEPSAATAAAPPLPPEGASAADVARELESQPETAPVASTASTTTAPAPAAKGDLDDALSAIANAGMDEPAPTVTAAPVPPAAAVAATTTAAAPNVPPASQGPALTARLRQGVGRTVAKVDQTARGIMWLCNYPLLRCSPTMRDALGLSGLVSAGFAVAMWFLLSPGKGH